MKIKLTESEVYRSITGMYDAIATRLGFNADICQYDCRKIKVAGNIFDRIYEWYKKNENYGPETMGMAWCCFGPKCDENLAEYEVDIEDGFISEVESDNTMCLN